MSEVYLLKLWILSGALAALVAILGFITKKAFDRFIAKLDELILEVQKLNSKDLLIDKDIEQIKQSIQDIKEQHEMCVNYKPTRKR